LGLHHNGRIWFGLIWFDFQNFLCVSHRKKALTPPSHPPPAIPQQLFIWHLIGWMLTLMSGPLILAHTSDSISEDWGVAIQENWPNQNPRRHQNRLNFQQCCPFQGGGSMHSSALRWETSNVQWERERAIMTNPDKTGRTEYWSTTEIILTITWWNDDYALTEWWLTPDRMMPSPWQNDA
jgi:hypothetical protein